MIDCVTENVWYKKKPVKKSFWVFFLILFFLISIILYYSFVIKKVIYHYCDRYLYTQGVSSINKAVNLTLNNQSYYDQIIKIDKDSQGNVVLITVDSFKVNKISREVEKNSNNFLKSELENGVKIPFLAFLGLDFLSGYGKCINFKNFSISNIICQFDSVFESVGINQTIHKIYVSVCCETYISIPFMKMENDFNSKVLIGETIIVGKIPDIYLNGKLFS